MSKLRVACFSISLDGYGAGPRQDMDNPLGVGGFALHDWFLPTRTFKRMQGEEGGTTGIDDDFAARGFENVGAWILGRNMFGPARGPWPDDTWKGWWGDEPPYRVPVFVLTHHPRGSIEMKGGTTFHFVTDGIESALAQARAAAGDKDVRLGGGVATVRQYVEARLVDELHLAISPVLLGSGEHLFAGLDWAAHGYRCAEQVATSVTHVVLNR
jgi:dihydrofolate reductase